MPLTIIDIVVFNDSKVEMLSKCNICNEKKLSWYNQEFNGIQ